MILTIDELNMLALYLMPKEMVPYYFQGFFEDFEEDTKSTHSRY